MTIVISSSYPSALESRPPSSRRNPNQTQSANSNSNSNHNHQPRTRSRSHSLLAHVRTVGSGGQHQTQRHQIQQQTQQQAAQQQSPSAPRKRRSIFSPFSVPSSLPFFGGGGSSGSSGCSSAGPGSGAGRAFGFGLGSNSTSSPSHSGSPSFFGRASSSSKKYELQTGTELVSEEGDREPEWADYCNSGPSGGAGGGMGERDGKEVGTEPTSHHAIKDVSSIAFPSPPGPYNAHLPSVQGVDRTSPSARARARESLSSSSVGTSSSTFPPFSAPASASASAPASASASAYSSPATSFVPLHSPQTPSRKLASGKGGHEREYGDNDAIPPRRLGHVRTASVPLSRVETRTTCTAPSHTHARARQSIWNDVPGSGTSASQSMRPASSGAASDGYQGPSTTGAVRSFGGSTTLGSSETPVAPAASASQSRAGAAAVQRRIGGSKGRTHSFPSLRDIAAAYLPSRFSGTAEPGPSASQSDSSTASNMTARSPVAHRRSSSLAHASGDARSQHRSVRLSRRHIDKAVSLAVEAAQAVEEDDRIWAEKRAERYLAVQERAQALARAQTDAQLCARALTMQTCESESALGLHMQIASSEKDRDGKERQIGSLPRLTGFPLLPSLEIDIDGDGEEGDDSPDSNFSLELYISSLGYLLSALPSRDASHMDEMHRIEMRARLEEGLCRIGVDPSAELERAVALRVEREREREEAPFPKEIHHHHHYHGQTGNGGACGPLASLAHLCGSSAARRQRAVTTSRIRPRTQSVPALISSAALDLGLTLGAGALSTATKSLGCLASHISSIEQGKNETDSQGTELSDVPADVPPPAPSQQAAFASRAGAALGLGLSGKQWEMAVAVAGKAASVLASSLWAIALPSHSRSKVDNDDEDDDIDDAGKNLLPAHVCDLAALSSSSVPAGSSETYTPTAEDRLILLAATLARSLKRSPLPSQARAMLLQLVQVMQAFDRRFELRRKAVDVALEKTAKTLKWARRHQLHTRVVKFAWVAGEAALAAIEAYRDEKGWDPLTKTTGKEAALAMTAAAAADVNVSMPMPMSTREKDAQSQSLARRDP